MTKTVPARPFEAALWMVGAITGFTTMALAGRAVAAELDTFETMMYRSFVGVILVVVVAWSMGRLGEVTTKRLGLHGARNICHFFGQNLWFYAVTVIPFAQLFALEFTSPLWVLVLAPLFLGERLTRVRVLAGICGFIGILIVVRPGAEPIGPGVIAAAASAIGFAGSIIFTKILTRTETVTAILFWLTVMQSIFGVITAAWDGDIALPSRATLPYVLLISVAGLVAHLCLTNALSVAPATLVVPMDFLRLPIIALIGMAFYDEPVALNVIFGAVLIFAANYANIWVEAKHQRRVRNAASQFQGDAM